uniref:Transposase n=1 Tax=Ascaris lumbricoides TaxID=6252 RepID=A0A0M3HVA6_ASCLU
MRAGAHYHSLEGNTTRYSYWCSADATACDARREVEQLAIDLATQWYLDNGEEILGDKVRHAPNDDGRRIPLPNIPKQPR